VEISSSRAVRGEYKPVRAAGGVLLAFLLAVGVLKTRKSLMKNELKMEARVGIGLITTANHK
jgi:hypothetical protein